MAVVDNKATPVLRIGGPFGTQDDSHWRLPVNDQGATPIFATGFQSTSAAGETPAGWTVAQPGGTVTLAVPGVAGVGVRVQRGAGTADAAYQLDYAATLARRSFTFSFVLTPAAFPGAATQPRVWMASGPTQSCVLYANPSGTLTLGGSIFADVATPGLVLGQPNLIEVQVSFETTNAWVACRVNGGAPVTQTATGVAEQIIGVYLGTESFGGTSAAGTYDFHYSHLAAFPGTSWPGRVNVTGPAGAYQAVMVSGYGGAQASTPGPLVRVPAGQQPVTPPAPPVAGVGAAPPPPGTWIPDAATPAPPGQTPGAPQPLTPDVGQAPAPATWVPAPAAQQALPAVPPVAQPTAPGVNQAPTAPGAWIPNPQAAQPPPAQVTPPGPLAPAGQGQAPAPQGWAPPSTAPGAPIPVGRVTQPGAPVSPLAATPSTWIPGPGATPTAPAFLQGVRQSQIVAQPAAQPAAWVPAQVRTQLSALLGTQVGLYRAPGVFPADGAAPTIPPSPPSGGAPPWGREHPHTHHGDRVVDTRDPRDIRELDDLFPFPGILIV